MISLSRDDMRAVVAEARLAPSVHNIQPTRWRLAGDGGIELVGDPHRSIPVADPDWRDWRLSHGAALEGLSIALATRGLGIAALDLRPAAPLTADGDPHTIAKITVTSQVQATRAEVLPTATRASWRGSFLPVDRESDARLDKLAAARDDVVLVRGAKALSDVAALGDKAGLHFLREDAHRKELLEWLRLSRGHARYQQDGLNAEAMALSPIEAWGAGLVLGPLFTALDRVGLAAPLVSESPKTKSSSAVVLFHRAIGEDAFVSGRAFYRVWLEMERQGLKGCPISVLADWPEAREALATRFKVPAGRKIISVFRIGQPKGQPKISHARLAVDELLA